jgi:AraC-like DNA-binding protein
MDYRTFQPHAHLQSFVKCYWTLEVPADGSPTKQTIIPDGCIEMAFILGDDIKRYTSTGSFSLQPRAMVLGQTSVPFDIEPTGYVKSFAVRFYPYGFANFVTVPINSLANTETPIAQLFEASQALELQCDIIQAQDTEERIKIIENFLFDNLLKSPVIDKLVNSTIDVLLSTQGSMSINRILKDNLSGRRQLERKFLKHIGISPKQLAKVIRLQSALKILLNSPDETLCSIAYESEYFDQSHFIRDFKEFTGTTPNEFLDSERVLLSSMFYRKS